jgi:putative oxidoreductase
MGLRSDIGVIFIVHGISKFNPGFTNFLTNNGISVEMQIPLALAELVPGILLITGILSILSGLHT